MIELEEGKQLKIFKIYRTDEVDEQYVVIACCKKHALKQNGIAGDWEIECIGTANAGLPPHIVSMER